MSSLFEAVIPLSTWLISVDNRAQTPDVARAIYAYCKAGSDGLEKGKVRSWGETVSHLNFNLSLLRVVAPILAVRVGCACHVPSLVSTVHRDEPGVWREKSHTGATTPQF